MQAGELLLEDRDATAGQGCSGNCDQALSPPSFETVFYRYQPIVYGVCLKFMGNPQDAEDLTQEVFTKIWKGLAAFNYSSSLKTWIYRIAVNTCIDHRRRPCARIDLHSTTIDDTLESGAVDTLVSPGESAEHRLIEQEEAARVRRAITRLRPNLKAVLVLKDLEELSYDEISSVLGLSMGTISSRLNRARKALMELFRPAARPALQEY